jgi:hypothetical protein
MRPPSASASCPPSAVSPYRRSGPVRSRNTNGTRPRPVSPVRPCKAMPPSSAPPSRG